MRPVFSVIAFVAFSATLFVSCRREKDINTNTPAYRIGESEKLHLPAAVDLPPNLPNGNKRVATLYAEGVQRYKAQLIPGSSPVAYQWVFVSPKATLYNADNKKTGTHGAGPFWELSSTDSIFAQAFSPPKAVAGGDAASIDWLQLMPKPGTTPTGIFAGIDYIQRIATEGGKAPTSLPLTATDSVDVPYTAVYRFSKKNP